MPLCERLPIDTSQVDVRGYQPRCGRFRTPLQQKPDSDSGRALQKAELGK